MSKKVYQKTTIYDGGFLHGIREIAEWMRLSPGKVYRLMDKGLPVAKGENDRYFTSKSLLDEWVKGVYRFQQDEMRKRGRKNDRSDYKKAQNQITID